MLCERPIPDSASRIAVAFAVAFATLVSLALGCGSPEPASGDADTNSAEIQSGDARVMLASARQAYAAGDLEAAERHARGALIVRAGGDASGDASELLADVDARRGQTSAAIAGYRDLLGRHPDRTRQLAEKIIPLAIQTGDLFAAVEALQAVARAFPDDRQPDRDLAKLLIATGDVEGARRHARGLIRHGHGKPADLVLVAGVRPPPFDHGQRERLKELNPDDRRIDLGYAVAAAMADRWQVVAEVIAPVVRRHPDLPLAVAVALRAAAELSDRERYDRLVGELPDGIADQADYWVARAIVDDRDGRYLPALKAIARAIELRPDDGGIYNKAIPLARLAGADRLTRLLADRQARLLELRTSVQGFEEWRSLSQRNAIRTAEILRSLGRYWESFRWSQLAAKLPADEVDDLTSRLKAVQSGMVATMPWQVDFYDKAIRPRMDALAEQNRIAAASARHVKSSSLALESPTAAASTATNDPPAIRFQDQSRQRGLDFRGRIGVAPGHGGIMIYQTPGCGIAVVDFDRDGWPDLYAASAGGTVMQSDSDSNRLFRNRDGLYADVTTESASADRHYSQGVASGDYDGDGFADLAVGNLGRNQLFRNNGDGTFTNTTATSGFTGNRWTTSLAVADLNADGISDLVEVNYMTGDQWSREKCHFVQIDSHRSCAPSMFAAAADSFWIGRGDGTFAPIELDASKRELDAQVDASDLQPRHVPAPGRGLGVVVGALDESPGVDVLIANDTSANHFWSFPTDAGRPKAPPGNRTNTTTPPVRPVERAGLTGLAVGEQGHSQGCMGIAAADWDNDADLDLFVTNFENESNAFYDQVAAGLWRDTIRKRGLARESFEQVGFGCEFADFNNDGRVELIVANGNVDDMRFDGSTFEQPPQLFEQSSNRRWRAVPAESLGDYFGGKYLGRALATLDVNRDGRLDVAVTHLDRPLALLVNRTDTASPCVEVELIATAPTSGRDAVGAVVTWTRGDRTRTSFRTSGDGFLVANESLLRFAPAASRSTRGPDPSLTVTWPSGRVERFRVVMSADADNSSVRNTSAEDVKTAPFAAESRPGNRGDENGSGEIGSGEIDLPGTAVRAVTRASIRPRRFVLVEGTGRPIPTERLPK